MKIKKPLSRRESQTGHDSFKTLINATCLGEAVYRSIKTAKWTKLKWCGISSGHLLCFKQDKEGKPFVDVALAGYDVTFLERDGKKCNVIRISCPGCETHFFSLETKVQGDNWLQVNYFKFVLINYSLDPSILSFL